MTRPIGWSGGPRARAHAAISRYECARGSQAAARERPLPSRVPYPARTDWTSRANGNADRLPTLQRASNFWARPARRLQELGRGRNPQPAKGLPRTSTPQFLRRVLMKVILENKRSAHPAPHALPPGKSGWHRSRPEHSRHLVPARTAAGITEVRSRRAMCRLRRSDVRAGHDVPDGRVTAAGRTTPRRPPHPGSFSINSCGAWNDTPIIKAASPSGLIERRVPPPPRAPGGREGLRAAQGRPSLLNGDPT